MRISISSRLCFVGALALGVMLAWSIITPQKLLAEQGDLLKGGECREAVDIECPVYCFYSTYWDCVSSAEKICCETITGSGRGCGPGGDGCIEQDAEEYTCPDSCP